MMQTKHYRVIAQVGYFSLLTLIPLWHLWLSPPALTISPWLVVSIWFIPLLFPLKGILQGKPYTFAWCGFLALLYIMHAIVIIYSAYTESDIKELNLALLELFFASLFLIGNIYFAKYRGQELGLSIRKKKEKRN